MAEVLISRLKELGVTLLLRSTRRLTLTDAGVSLPKRREFTTQRREKFCRMARASHSGLGGELRITTTPESLANRVVIPVLKV